MIEFQNVQKFYTNNGVANIGLQNINVKFNKNEIVAITGESGSGKSTLLNVISKIDNFDEGEIYYKGNETSYFTLSDMDDFRKNKVGFIFQNYNILDSYTVLKNVMIPLLLKGKSKIEAKAEALLLIEKVGLKGRENHRGSKLSGGEKQRCVIARALAGDCEILACDEPTGNLDSQTAIEIIKLIKEVAKDKLVLIVSHNYQEVAEIVTRQIKMADGKIIEDIVYQEVVDDVNEELDLDYKPLSKKVVFSIATNNLTSTPRKTIITSIIFLIISFSFLFLIQLVSSGFAQMDMVKIYNNDLDNYLFVFNDNCEPIDVSYLNEYEYEVNNFAAESSTECFINNEYISLYYLSFIPKYQLALGDMPQNDNEFIIVLPVNEKSALKNLEKFIDKELIIGPLKTYTIEKFVLSGVVTIDQEFNNSYDTYFASGSPKLMDYLNKSCIYINGTVEYGKNIYDIHSSIKEGNNNPTLFLPYEFMGKSFDVDIYIEETYKYHNMNIEYLPIEEPYFCIFADGELNLEPYFAEVEVNSLNLNRIKKNIVEDGLDVVYPNEVTFNDDVSGLLMKFVTLIVNLELSCYLIGIFFITYVILSRIYISRTKDYQILRTLGVTKRDMRSIVNYEIVLLGMGITLLSAFLVNGLIYSVSNLYFMHHIAIDTYVFYYIIMFIFVYSMGKRFNKRLFKFTVRKSMKGVEEDDQD